MRFKLSLDQFTQIDDILRKMVIIKQKQTEQLINTQRLLMGILKKKDVIKLPNLENVIIKPRYTDIRDNIILYPSLLYDAKNNKYYIRQQTYIFSDQLDYSASSPIEETINLFENEQISKYDLVIINDMRFISYNNPSNDLKPDVSVIIEKVSATLPCIKFRLSDETEYIEKFDLDDNSVIFTKRDNATIKIIAEIDTWPSPEMSFAYHISCSLYKEIFKHEYEHYLSKIKEVGKYE